MSRPGSRCHETARPGSTSSTCDRWRAAGPLETVPCSPYSRSFQSPRDGAQQHAADVDAMLLVKFTDARGAGHVDLGDEVADHIQADENHSGGLEFRPDDGTQPPVAVVEGTALGPGPGREISAVVVGIGHSLQGEGHGLAVDKYHAAVAGRYDFGKVSLYDGIARAVVRQCLEHHVAVLVALFEHEDRAAPHAVQRLADGLAVLAQELAHVAHVARYQGRGAAFRNPRRV